MKLSEFYTLEECIKADPRYNNMPTEKQIEVIREWCIHIADPSRRFIGGPLGAWSVFRNELYNSSIPGADPHSEHMIKTNDSCAGDLDTDIHKVGNNTDLFWFIYKNCPFNILIWEFTDENTGHPKWVHASHSITRNKKLALRKSIVGGVTITSIYDGQKWVILKK